MHTWLPTQALQMWHKLVWLVYIKPNIPVWLWWSGISQACFESSGGAETAQLWSLWTCSQELKVYPDIYRMQFWISIQDCICRSFITKEPGVLGSHYLINPTLSLGRTRRQVWSSLFLHIAWLGEVPDPEEPQKKMLHDDSGFYLLPILSSGSHIYLVRL